MSNPFKALERETFRLIKSDGKIIDNLRTSGITENKVRFRREDIDFEEGDILERDLPHGKVEKYVVEDVEYTAKFQSIPASYILRVANLAKPKQTPTPHSVTYNLYGANSRVNNHSNDHSRNIIGIDTNDLFEKVEEVLEGAVSNQQELQDLRHQLTEMRANQGQPAFTANYVRFMEIAADHITVLTPFLPALAQLLIFAGTGQK